MTAQDRLREKIERCYNEYEAKWLSMTPEQLVYICEEVYAVTLTYKVITREGVPHETVDWLQRFKDPLQVISDAWRYANDMDTVICEAQFDSLIDDLYDKRDAENEYSMENRTVSETP